MKKKICSLGARVGTLLFLAGMPIFAFAQFKGTPPEDAQGFIDGIIGFINGSLIQLVFAIALIVFLWGLTQAFIIGGASEDKRNQGKQLMLWGIIAFFVMVSVWGLVRILTDTFGFTGNEGIKPPQIETTTPNSPRNI